MNTLKHLYQVVLLTCLCIGCSDLPERPEFSQKVGTEQAPEVSAIDVMSSEALMIEATSFSGEPLYRRAVDAVKKGRYELLIGQLNQKDSLTEDEYVTLGGYYASINQFRDAIDVYSRGLLQIPDSFKLRRFRAHRYISIRELDKAIVDLNEALALLEKSSSENEIEYSVNGESHGKYELWIWYHIGLYHYLKADYVKASQAYEKSIESVSQDKYLVSITDWLYNSYQKSGDSQAANRALARISADTKTDKDHPYYKRVMLYKGLVSAEDIFDFDKPANQWTVREMTIAYGVANWYHYQGNSKAAEKLHKNILQRQFWSSWAYVATEKEYAK